MQRLSLSPSVLVLGLLVAAPVGAQPRTNGVVGRPCRDDEVPYFAAGCDGPAHRRCWSAAVRPTPMAYCSCDGRTSSAPLPGGGLRWRHAGACASVPTSLTPPTPPAPATPTNVSAWLARCANAERNGLNPQIAVPSDLTTAGRDALLDAVAHAPRDRRPCATWALSRHAPVREMRPFWRTQLARSRDAQVLTEAFIALSELADAAARRAPAPAPMLAGRLRSGRDRRAAFAQEQAAWERVIAGVRPTPGLEPDWIEMARPALETPAR